jgi:hypothetical protein
MTDLPLSTFKISKLFNIYVWYYTLQYASYFLNDEVRKVSWNYKHLLIRNRKFMQPTLISFEGDGMCQTNTPL